MVVWRVMRNSHVQGAWVAFILAFLTVNFFIPASSYFQGKYYPVVSYLQVSKIAPFLRNGEPYVLITGATETLRACSFVKVEWFLGTRGATKVPLGMPFTSTPLPDTTGPNHWGGIIAGATPDQVLTATFADALHYCPLLWGLVSVPARTPYYDIGLSTAKVEVQALLTGRAFPPASKNP